MSLNVEEGVATEREVEDEGAGVLESSDSDVTEEVVTMIDEKHGDEGSVGDADTTHLQSKYS